MDMLVYWGLNGDVHETWGLAPFSAVFLHPSGMSVYTSPGRLSEQLAGWLIQGWLGDRIHHLQNIWGKNLVKTEVHRFGPSYFPTFSTCLWGEHTPIMFPSPMFPLLPGSHRVPRKSRHFERTGGLYPLVMTFTAIAMERSTMLLRGKPSISIRAIEKPWLALLVITRLGINEIIHLAGA